MVLKNIDLEMKPGEMIGLVGRSGVGKSTLINLIMRLYEPSGGRILIDGTDKTALCKINNQKGSGILPEEAFKRMVKKYPQVLELIRLSK